MTDEKPAYKGISGYVKGIVKCPYCGKHTNFKYHIDMNSTEWCEHCKKKFEVIMSFEAKKVSRVGGD